MAYQGRIVQMDVREMGCLELTKHLDSAIRLSWGVRSAKSLKWCCNKKRPPSAHRVHEVLEELPYPHTLADASA